MQNIKKIRKMKEKRKHINIMIIIVFIICLLSISYGYSVWNSELKIVGTAIAKQEIVDSDTIPVTILPQGGENEFVVAQIDSATLSEQYIEGNTLFVKYAINSTTGKPRTAVIDLVFTNTQESTLENGTATCEISGSTSFFSTTTTVTTTQSIEPGENGNIRINLGNLKFNNISGRTASCKVQITYTLNNKTEVFYVQIDFAN